MHGQLHGLWVERQVLPPAIQRAGKRQGLRSSGVAESVRFRAGVERKAALHKSSPQDKTIVLRDTDDGTNSTSQGESKDKRHVLDNASKDCELPACL